MRNAIAGLWLLCAIALSADAQTTRPESATDLDRAALEIRANQEFGRGQYAVALPMLRKLAELSRERPDLLGPIEEKIRVCERNLNAAAGDSPRSGPQNNLARKPHPPPQPGQIIELSIKELGNFDYDVERGGNIPQDVRQLSGATVRLSGFMIPMDQAANITQFALVPDLFACCFGQPPQLQHTVIVHCPKGKAVSYYPDEIIVQGTLNVQEKKDEGFIVSIFEVEASSVKPAAK
jgi:hypothetical protein